MVCKIIADCLNVPNLWTKHTKIDTSRIITTGNHYPDYAKNPSVCTMSTLSGMSTPDTITIGHTAYCICCGNAQHEYNVLDCCDSDDNEDDMRVCESCSNEIHADDAVWVRDHCYCPECTSYCDHCERHHYLDDVKWVDDIGMSVCNHCYDDDFAKCTNCDKVVKRDDADDAYGDSYCDKCFCEQFSICEECSEGFEKEELTEVERRLVCRDCHCGALTEQESCELVTA
jgi:hypothetical protein